MRQGQGMDSAVRQAIADGLARRAAQQQGVARQLIEQRRAAWLDLPTSTSTAPTAPAAPALQGLSALVDRLGRMPQANASLESPHSPAPNPLPLKAVAAHHDTWSRLRAEQRLRQALAQVPAKAGPLNSAQVVHRALKAMHGLSPSYLDAFMAHIDTLLWLEQSSGAGDLAPRAQARPEGRRRAAPRIKPPPA